MLKNEVVNDVAGNIAQLEFGDGDMELMYHEDPRGRSWLHGVETFHSVKIDQTPRSEHVEFRMLTDDDLDMLAQPDKPYSRDYLSPHKLRFMADVAFSRAVKFTDGPEWTWYAQGVPLPATMNRIAGERFRPLGAHDLQLGLLDGDGDDRLFTSTAMVHAIADGFIPVSTTARYFRHDMGSHSVGMLALDAKTMGTVQRICQCMVELEPGNEEEVKRISDEIIAILDYYTYEKYFMAEEISSSKSPLLKAIMSSSEVQGSVLKDKILKAARSNGVWFSDSGYMTRNNFIAQYHRQLRKFFDASRDTVKN